MREARKARIDRELGDLGFSEFKGQEWVYGYFKGKDQDRSGRRSYLQGWSRFLDYHGLTGDELVDRVRELVRERNHD
ncbi:MAG: hypothetical protein ACETV0_04755, partial [Nitrososphaeria archaeon]